MVRDGNLLILDKYGERWQLTHTGPHVEHFTVDLHTHIAIPGQGKHENTHTHTHTHTHTQKT